MSMIKKCEHDEERSRAIKNELRVPMCQERLPTLSILYIESGKLRRTDFDELLDDFAKKKVGKNLFYLIVVACLFLNIILQSECLMTTQNRI